MILEFNVEAEPFKHFFRHLADTPSVRAVFKDLIDNLEQNADDLEDHLFMFADIINSVGDRALRSYVKDIFEKALADLMMEEDEDLEELNQLIERIREKIRQA